MFFDPQGTQATDQSKGGLQGLTFPQHWPFLSGSEAFDLGMHCFPRGNSENAGFIGAIEPAQMLVLEESVKAGSQWELRTGKEQGTPDSCLQ